MKPPKTPSVTGSTSEAKVRWLPEILLGVFLTYLAVSFVPPKGKTLFNLNGFAQMPVLNGGRTKPLDTIARTSLLVLSGKQSIRVEGKRLSAIEWLSDMAFRPEHAAAYPVFTIDDPDVLGTMGITQTTKRRFSFSELQSHASEIENQAMQANQAKPEQRSRFQSAVLTLANTMHLYQKLLNTLQPVGATQQVESLQSLEKKLSTLIQAHMQNPKNVESGIKAIANDIEQYRFLDNVAEFHPLPVREGFKLTRDWWTMGHGVLDRMQSDAYHPGVMVYATIADAYRSDNFRDFNQAVEGYRQWLITQVPRELSLSHYEWVFNYFEPFYRAMLIYLIVFLLICVSWLLYPKTMIRAGFYLLILAFTVHTVGLVSRMILQGRPPVTNLYSSAIFVGWVAVILGVALERLYRNGIGSMVASLIGFLTLIVAHHLASSGDTLEMMRAVLDSNFWLATHVVCITIGYGSTFLSGFLAAIYIVRQRIDPTWNEESASALDRMVYGIVCFSLLFSFVGTILGGIWADQSWGRFWGWDPKENGALMIVLWNAFILHARWGKTAGRRGVMAMAVFGNVVTAFSWFGVNMLGIGLHSYGFMDKAFVWLLAFSASQLALIGLGLSSRD